MGFRETHFAPPERDGFFAALVYKHFAALRRGQHSCVSLFSRDASLIRLNVSITQSTPG